MFKDVAVSYISLKPQIILNVGLMVTYIHHAVSVTLEYNGHIFKLNNDLWIVFRPSWATCMLRCRSNPLLCWLLTRKVINFVSFPTCWNIRWAQRKKYPDDFYRWSRIDWIRRMTLFSSAISLGEDGSKHSDQRLKYLLSNLTPPIPLKYFYV